MDGIDFCSRPGADCKCVKLQPIFWPARRCRKALSKFAQDLPHLLFRQFPSVDCPLLCTAKASHSVRHEECMQPVNSAKLKWAMCPSVLSIHSPGSRDMQRIWGCHEQEIVYTVRVSLERGTSGVSQASLGYARQVVYLEQEVELRGQQGSVRDRQLGSEGSHKGWVQLDQSSHALARQSQMLGCDGLQPSNLHGSCSQHKLAHPCVEHLSVEMTKHWWSFSRWICNDLVPQADNARLACLMCCLSFNSV